jgi:hypothetical protein
MAWKQRLLSSGVTLTAMTIFSLQYENPKHDSLNMFSRNILANACAHKPEPRHRDGQRAVMNPQTVMRQEYAEIAERGLGLCAALC